jgi:hypothetical protein
MNIVAQASGLHRGVSFQLAKGNCDHQQAGRLRHLSKLN